jgi:hypothetical protein
MNMAPAPMRSRIFFYSSVSLFIAAIAAACIALGYEAAVVHYHLGTQKVVGAFEMDPYWIDKNRLSLSADHWHMFGFIAVLLAVLFWFIALWRHEKFFSGCMIVLLVLYIIFELILV